MKPGPEQKNKIYGREKTDHHGTVPGAMINSLAYSKTAKWLVLISLFFMGAIFGYRRICSPDLGFHLSSARWILQNGTVPKTDIFTYTVPNNTYIDLQWLFQLVVYGLETSYGPAGIIVLTTLLTLIFGASLLWRVYRNQGRIPQAAVVMLGLFFLGNLWEIRPHLFSWIWGSLILLVLEENSRGRNRWLPLLPVFMLLWVNTHSLYVLGLVVIGVYVFSDLVKGFRFHCGIQVDKKLMLWSLAAVLACLINPYHIKGLQFPISQFFLVHSASGYKSALTGTSEFLSPFRFQEYYIDGRFVLFQPRLWWQLFTLLAVTGILGVRKKTRLVEWVLFVGFLYIFHQASKNFGYFTMACFPVIIAGLSQTGNQISVMLSHRSSMIKSVFCIAMILIYILLSMAAGSNCLYESGWQEARTGFGYDTETLPVEACRFLNEHDIQGRIINCWNDGGYIGWATNQKVFINSEGNTIGLKFYDEYIAIREPEHFTDGLKKWKPTVAMVRYTITPYWLYHLFNVAKDWRMIYADDHIAVFLQDSIAPHIPALPAPVAGRDYPVYEVQAIEAVVRQAVDAGGPGLMQWLRGSGAYPLSEMQKSAFYLHTGRIEACIGISVSGLQRVSFMVPELMLNLGHALNARRQYALADRCYNAFLSVSDDPVLTYEISVQRSSRH